MTTCRESGEGHWEKREQRWTIQSLGKDPLLPGAADIPELHVKVPLPVKPVHKQTDRQGVQKLPILSGCVCIHACVHLRSQASSLAAQEQLRVPQAGPAWSAQGRLWWAGRGVLTAALRLCSRGLVLRSSRRWSGSMT